MFTREVRSSLFNMTAFFFLNFEYILNYDIPSSIFFKLKYPLLLSCSSKDEDNKDF